MFYKVPDCTMCASGTVQCAFYIHSILQYAAYYRMYIECTLYIFMIFIDTYIEKCECSTKFQTVRCVPVELYSVHSIYILFSSMLHTIECIQNALYIFLCLYVDYVVHCERSICTILQVMTMYMNGIQNVCLCQLENSLK